MFFEIFLYVYQTIRDHIREDCDLTGVNFLDFELRKSVQQ